MAGLQGRARVDQFIVSLANAPQSVRYRLVGVFVFVQCVQFTAWFVVCAYWPSVQEYVQGPLLRQLVPFELLLVLLVLLACHALWRLPTQPTRRMARRVPYLLSFGYTSIMLHYFYLLGCMSIGVGLAAIGSLMFGLVMVQRRASYMAISYGALGLVALAVASNMGQLIYAPVFSDQAFDHADGRMFQFFTILYFFLPHALLVIVMLDFMVHGLLRQQGSLRFLSEHDGLTGLLNRRTVTERMLALARVSEQGVLVSVLLLDLDFFKQINDRHGHLAGDRVLRAVAQVMQGHLQEDRLIGRFGGEEFIVVLPHCGMAVAQALAEQIRQQFLQVQVTDAEGEPIAVTASFGVAVGRLYPDQAEIELIHQADQALYAAKQQGRNRVVMYTPGMTPVHEPLVNPLAQRSTSTQAP